MSNFLSDEMQQVLREEKIITDTEVAVEVGDKFVAENILSKSRRVIHIPGRLLESSNSKRVLRG